MTRKPRSPGRGFFHLMPAIIPGLGFALRPPSCPSIFVRCPRGVGGSAGRVHGRTAALRTPAVPAHLKKEEPRAGGGSRLLSLDIFEPSGGVSGDGGCRSARAEAPRGKRQLQLHLSVVRPECLYRPCLQKEKEPPVGRGSAPILADGPLATTPPVRAGLMQASAPFRSGQRACRPALPATGPNRDKPLPPSRSASWVGRVH